MKVKGCWLGGNNERREGGVSSGGSRRRPPGEREKAAVRGEREERGGSHVCVRVFCGRCVCVCVLSVFMVVRRPGSTETPPGGGQVKKRR